MSLESEAIGREMYQERLEQDRRDLIDLKLFIVGEIQRYNKLANETESGAQYAFYDGWSMGLNSVLQKL
jgi:hypothetical protein